LAKTFGQEEKEEIEKIALDSESILTVNLR